ILSSHIVHDTRLEFNTNHSTTTPLVLGQSISVLDSFNAGGSSNVTNNTNHTVQFGNTMIYNSKGFTLKAGTQGEYYSNDYFNQNNFKGSYTFSSLNCKVDPNNPAPISDPSTDPRCAGAYSAGRPTTFTIN